MYWKCVGGVGCVGVGGVGCRFVAGHLALILSCPATRLPHPISKLSLPNQHTKAHFPPHPDTTH